MSESTAINYLLYEIFNNIVLINNENRHVKFQQQEIYVYVYKVLTFELHWYRKYYFSQECYQRQRRSLSDLKRVTDVLGAKTIQSLANNPLFTDSPLKPIMFGSGCSVFHRQGQRTHPCVIPSGVIMWIIWNICHLLGFPGINKFCLKTELTQMKLLVRGC